MRNGSQNKFKKSSECFFNKTNPFNVFVSKKNLYNRCNFLVKKLIKKHCCYHTQRVKRKRHNIWNIYIATDSFSQFTQLNIVTINNIYNEQLYTTLLGQAKESTEMYRCYLKSNTSCEYVCNKDDIEYLLPQTKTTLLFSDRLWFNM